MDARREHPNATYLPPMTPKRHASLVALTRQKNVRPGSHTARLQSMARVELLAHAMGGSPATRPPRGVIPPHVRRGR